MERTVAAGVVVFLLVTTIPGTVVGVDGENEAPLVDAGLDQRVGKGAQVQLDGSDTEDPDGRIVDYEWTIETPNGTTVAPACGSCVRTSFTAADTGVYVVTLSATDDDGATRTDTLYVTVEGGETPPAISLDAPNGTHEGVATDLTASISAGSADLDHIVWSVDGTPILNTSLADGESTATLQHRFATTGGTTVTARVVDEANRSANASRDVEVYPIGKASFGGGGGGGSWDMRVEIVGPKNVEPGEGARYQAVVHGPVLSPDAFVYNWSGVDGVVGPVGDTAYREFTAEPGANISISARAKRYMGPENAGGVQVVHVMNDTGDVDWTRPELFPTIELEAPDMVTACEPTDIWFEAGDANSGVGARYDDAGSYDYVWSNVDSSTDRWAKKTVSANSGQSKEVHVRAKVLGGISRQRTPKNFEIEDVTVFCPERNVSQSTTYTEFHWTKPAGTRQVNMTTSPDPDARIVKRTNKEKVWVTGTKVITESSDSFYSQAPGYELRKTETVIETETETTLAETAPSDEWTLVEENADRRVARSGTTYWYTEPQPKPEWADEWSLVDTKSSAGTCGPMVPDGICDSSETLYKYSFTEYEKVHEWERTIQEAVTEYVYQKRNVTAWYLWEYEGETKEMVTNYDPRDRDVSIEGSVVRHVHPCVEEDEAPVCESGEKS